MADIWGSLFERAQTTQRAAEVAHHDLQANIRQRLADPDGILVLDETGFLKGGVKSAGWPVDTAAQPDASENS